MIEQNCPSRHRTVPSRSAWNLTEVRKYPLSGHSCASVALQASMSVWNAPEAVFS